VIAASAVLMGVLIDRKGVAAADALMLAAGSLGLVLMLFMGQEAVVFPAVVLLGIGSTFGYISIPFLVAAVGRNRDNTTAYGIASASCSASGVVSPIACNAVFDLTGSYEPSIIALLAMLAVGGVILIRMLLSIKMKGRDKE